jgi:hypothetical protein
VHYHGTSLANKARRLYNITYLDLVSAALSPGLYSRRKPDTV